jgi:ubiquinone/menaquinone biosynthesis C-methylase UbiE
MEAEMAGSGRLPVLFNSTVYAFTSLDEGAFVSQTLLPRCLCGSENYQADVINDIPVLRCGTCGVIRQQVPLSLSELADWYRDHYIQSKYTHTYDHDLRVAEMRLSAYRLQEGQRLLDVGCGNSAFVDAARARGLDAWGQDLSATSEGPHTYVGPLEDIAFPTDYFDVLTLHDVLEHHPEPGAFLRECARVLRPGGQLILDFPRFHHERGKHHWKLTEHLWMLDEGQLSDLLTKSGFEVKNLYHPLASKIVIFADRRTFKRPQILVPSGIGDAYWVMTKLQGFLKQNKLGLPDVWVQDASKAAHLRRAEPFLQTIPFVHAAGYKLSNTREPIFHEAYFQNARTVFPNELDVDYFIAYNGVMRHGASLEQVDPQFGCNWFPKMHISKGARAYQAKMEAEGPYVVAYFVQAGMYSHWLADFPLEQIEKALQALEAITHLRVVVIGAGWDAGSLGDKMAQRNPSWVNLVGKTTFEELQGTLRGASLVTGYPSGASILGPVFRRPTVLLWNRYFNRGFWLNSVPPGTPYRALDTDGLTWHAMMAACAEVLGK